MRHFSLPEASIQPRTSYLKFSNLVCCPATGSGPSSLERRVSKIFLEIRPVTMWPVENFQTRPSLGEIRALGKPDGTAVGRWGSPLWKWKLCGKNYVQAQGSAIQEKNWHIPVNQKQRRGSYSPCRDATLILHYLKSAESCASTYMQIK